MTTLNDYISAIRTLDPDRLRELLSQSRPEEIEWEDIIYNTFKAYKNLRCKDGGMENATHEIIYLLLKYCKPCTKMILLLIEINMGMDAVREFINKFNLIYSEPIVNGAPWEINTDKYIRSINPSAMSSRTLGKSRELFSSLSSWSKPRCGKSASVDRSLATEETIEEPHKLETMPGLIEDSLREVEKNAGN